MTAQKAISNCHKLIKLLESADSNVDWSTAIETLNMAIDALNMYWRPFEFETDIPPLDDEGYSERVLLSFDNAIDPDIGEYRQDEDGGGAFYIGDTDDTYAGLGLIVNGWMPLPESLREGEG